MLYLRGGGQDSCSKSPLLTTMLDKLLCIHIAISVHLPRTRNATSCTIWICLLRAESKPMVSMN